MKRTLQIILLIIVSVIALNSCKDKTPTFTVYEFDNSQTKATSIGEYWAFLEFRICRPETGNNYLGYDVYMAIADYPEYFKGEERSNGWSEVQNLGELYAGNFETSFFNLVPNTTYYYAPYVSSDRSFQHSIIQGEVKSFTTPKHMVPLEEFYGTYTMTYYDTSNESDLQTWSNVYIVPDQDGYLYITNLPPHGFTAVGSWDTDNYYLEMSSLYYFLEETVTIDNEKYYCLFTPIYYDRVSGNASWTWWNDGSSYINFEWISDGIIKMTTSPKKGENGLNSNAFTWRYLNVSSEENVGNSHFYYNVTLTKTSSNYAPARGPVYAPKKNVSLRNKIQIKL